MTIKVPQNVLDSVWGSVAADWHQHENGKGWVYKTAHVDSTVYLHPTSIVSGNARVSGNAWVYGNAWVSGNARVCGDAWVFSPLYIQGTRHAVTLCSHKQIAIGCHIHDITEWQKKYRAIGKMEGYTPAQIEEYGTYITLLAKAAKVAVKAAKANLAVSASV